MSIARLTAPLSGLPLLTALLSGLVLLTACATPPPAAQSPANSTPQATTTAPPPPQPTPTAAPPAATAPAAKTCTVPDVVGMVHQTAQDTMQAAGLYRLREEDATGQGRLLAVDRNWTTTAQSVRAGEVVDCTTEILLSAKKTGE
ncbi:hypothetical protein FHS29_005579 [Saccharothrix tamanrassetensis]|uniref:PASTA domain-containing protein n=1 Tax=Saccharothrix tamanrassetensis TaxID=1051531 RepID=A0A841CP68_9PSEU|nr:hypothetical protein [Saccharothrix tamanrassetensis]MBB5958970.1 hypothetical protein [Saccharothrix tamanrassetensis]